MEFDEIQWDEMFEVEYGSRCSCGVGIYKRYGIEIEFWEPIRIIETVKDKYCSPARSKNFKKDDQPEENEEGVATSTDEKDLEYGDADGNYPGGLPSIADILKNPSFFDSKQMTYTGQNQLKDAAGELSGKGTHSDETSKEDNSHIFQNVHMYIPPAIWAALVVNDLRCVETSFGNPSKYLSEADPAWQDDTLASVKYPMTVIYYDLLLGGETSFLATMGSCVADAIASQGQIPLDLMFHCLGAWGFTYPMSGNVNNDDFSSANATVAARAIYIGGRTGRVLDAATILCTAIPMPLLIKSYFKLQQIRPVSRTHLIGMGESSLLWGIADNPLIDECKDNYAWILWRKRRCCGYY